MGRQDPHRSILPERDSANLRGTDQRAKPDLLERATSKTTTRQGRRKVGCEPRQPVKGITLRELGARTVTGYYSLSRIPQNLIVGTQRTIGDLTRSPRRLTTAVPNKAPKAPTRVSPTRAVTQM